MANKKYHIITIGCQMNKSDSERFAGFLEKNGYQRSDERSQADLIVVNTCGVRQSAENRAYGLIPEIKKRNKKAKIILTGCLVYRDDVKKRLDRWVDEWLPIVDIPKIKSLSTRPGSNNQNSCDYLKIEPKMSSNFSAFIPIGNGCDNYCSYCVVPYARGKEIYRSAKEIINEAKNLVDRGYKEVNLIAQNVNSYQGRINGRDINFSDLLGKINDIPGDFWIRFFTSHPKDMSDEMINKMANCQKVCHHLHLPAQSGDDEILKKMNRHYTSSHYLGLINKAKSLMPDLAVTTDVIVGFPGENKKQFANSKKLFHQAQFDMAYLAQYSSRPGTAASKFEDNVSAKEKKIREEILNIELKKTAFKNNEKYLGKIVKVLAEERKKGEWFGRTGTNKVVKIKSGENIKAGEFVMVKIGQVASFGLVGSRQQDSGL